MTSITAVVLPVPGGPVQGSVVGRRQPGRRSGGGRAQAGRREGAERGQQRRQHRGRAPGSRDPPSCRAVPIHAAVADQSPSYRAPAAHQSCHPSIHGASPPHLCSLLPPCINATSFAASASVTPLSCGSSSPALSGCQGGGVDAKRGGRRPNRTSMRGAEAPRCPSPPRVCGWVGLGGGETEGRVAGIEVSWAVGRWGVTFGLTLLRILSYGSRKRTPARLASGGLWDSYCNSPSAPRTAAGTSLGWPSSPGAAARPAPRPAPHPLCQ